MGINRLTRVNELLKREIASALYRVINEGSFDFSAVTVTRVKVSSNLRHAHVFCSIRGTESGRKEMFRLLLKHRLDLQRDVADNVVLKYTPQLHFEVDHSVEDGDRVLHLLDQLDLPEDEEDEEDREDDEHPGYTDRTDPHHDP